MTDAQDAIARLRAKLERAVRRKYRTVMVWNDDARAIVEHIDTLAAERDAALAKVQKIVAWLREHDDDDADWYALGPFKYIATAIERGEYEEAGDD